MLPLCYGSMSGFSHFQLWKSQTAGLSYHASRHQFASATTHLLGSIVQGRGTRPLGNCPSILCLPPPPVRRQCPYLRTEQKFPIWPSTSRILMLLLPSTQGICEQSR